jgi:hypothetical protein
MPFGFFLLFISYLLLSMHMISLTLNEIDDFSGILMWTRVISQTAGFTLIALSYFVASRYQGTTKRSYLAILLGTTLLITSILVCFFAILGDLEFVSIYSSPIRIFTVINLILLSYITLFLLRKIKSTGGSLKKTLSGLLAFSSLLIGQFTFLSWSLVDLDSIFLIGSQVARFVGFVCLIQIYYSAKMEVSASACGQAK